MLSRGVIATRERVRWDCLKNNRLMAATWTLFSLPVILTDPSVRERERLWLELMQHITTTSIYCIQICVPLKKSLTKSFSIPFKIEKEILGKASCLRTLVFTFEQAEYYGGTGAVWPNWATFETFWLHSILQNWPRNWAAFVLFQKLLFWLKTPLAIFWTIVMKLGPLVIRSLASED